MISLYHIFSLLICFSIPNVNHCQILKSIRNTGIHFNQTIQCDVTLPLSLSNIKTEQVGSIFNWVLDSLNLNLNLNLNSSHENYSISNVSNNYHNNVKKHNNHINVSILTISADYISNSKPRNEFNIDGIHKYRDYHSGLLYIYALKQKYELKIMYENNSINYQSDDARWNKVMMLRNALHPTRGWARHSKYIMWIDSDAIVLDFELNIEEIFEIQYPHAHILMSADIRQGLVNSGIVLLRNSPYTRQFLSLWWGNRPGGV